MNATFVSSSEDEPAQPLPEQDAEAIRTVVRAVRDNIVDAEREADHLDALIRAAVENGADAHQIRLDTGVDEAHVHRILNGGSTWERIVDDPASLG